jgi:hypothetical protein
MSDPKPVVPTSAQQVLDNLTKLENHWGHVRGVHINPATSHLEIQLDGWAHSLGHTPDFYMPIKAKSVADARVLVERLVREAQQGQAPSLSEAQQLFDMIDQNPQ